MRTPMCSLSKRLMSRSEETPLDRQEPGTERAGLFAVWTKHTHLHKHLPTGRVSMRSAWHARWCLSRRSRSTRFEPPVFLVRLGEAAKKGGASDPFGTVVIRSAGLTLPSVFRPLFHGR